MKIALDAKATAAWKDAGESWEAVSSRIVIARLLLAKTGQRKLGGSRESKNKYMTVVSVHAPTERAPQGAKQKVSADLQDVLDRIPTQSKKNEAHEKMLQNNSVKNQKEIRRQQRVVKETVQAAKEKWILQVAREGERLAKMAA